MQQSQVYFESYQSFFEKKKISSTDTLVIITDDHVDSLWADQVYTCLAGYTKKLHKIVIPQGETSKSREQKEKLEDAFFKLGLDQNVICIALGGGVVTDLVGFVASTYCRGVKLILLPTTLLGQVDASIGGKNGVNTPYGKNLIGTIYHPFSVCIDVGFLQTLPIEQIKAGCAEIIKIACVMDLSLFETLEKKASQLLDMPQPELEEIIKQAVHLKLQAIQDPSIRTILNFGHTMAHALEALSSWQLSHGAAVAHGMIFATKLSSIYAGLSTTECDRILDLIAKLEYEPLFSVDLQEAFELMKKDKKNHNQTPYFVLLEKIGQAHSFEGVYKSGFTKEQILDSFLAIQPQG